MVNEGDILVQETLEAANNRDDVLGVLKGQAQVKIDLHNDAMDEIKPYLEQGV